MSLDCPLDQERLGRYTGCIVIWGSSFKSSIDPLQKLQNRILRAIGQFSRRSPVVPMYQSLNLLNISKIHMYFSCLYVFKSLMSDRGEFQYRDHARNTRQSVLNLLNEPFYRNVRSRQNLYYVGAKNWNSLPIAIRELGSLISFKNNLKTFLLSLEFETG